jgi:TolA-binding protein
VSRFKGWGIFPVLIIFSAVSCGTMGGKVPADTSAGTETETASEDIAEDDGEFDKEEPADSSTEEEQAEMAEVPEEPELSEPDTPPPEAPVSVRLPEPAPAEIPEAVPEAVSETVAEVPAPPAPPVPAAPSPPPPAPAPAPPPAAPPERTGPPPFIRPAEEPPPAPVREIPPPPAIPEPPAFIEIPLPAEEDIVFSRIVRATVGQLIEIPFRGTGWVYLGELASRRGIAYNSRRLDPEGQSFIFRAEAAGTYALKFYKQDFIRDYILNDHVQVIIGEAPDNTAAGWFSPPVDRGRVVAEPRWPTVAEEAESRRSGSSGQNAENTGADTAARPPASGTALPADGSRDRSADETGTPGTGADGLLSSTVQTPAPQPQDLPAPQAQDSAGVSESSGTTEGTAEASAKTGQVFVFPEDSLPEAYFEKALEEFNAGRVGGAIAVLDGFRERFPAGSDEAWWLLGQFYEASGPSRDIRAALDYYRRLIREFPQSRRYDDARRRIAYLERFYINIQ